MRLFKLTIGNDPNIMMDCKFVAMESIGQAIKKVQKKLDQDGNDWVVTKAEEIGSLED